MSKEKLREELARVIYGQTAYELACFIKEYGVDARPPRAWADKPDKEYWYKKADAILTLIQDEIKQAKLTDEEINFIRVGCAHEDWIEYTARAQLAKILKEFEEK